MQKKAYANRIRTKSAKLVIAVIALALVLFAITPISAFAAANPLKLTVRQVFTTASSSADGVFTYMLKPLATSNPMPSGSASRGYTFTIDGTDSLETGPINFTQPGTFMYELEQVIAVEETGYTYDRRVYELEVYVDSMLDVSLVIRNAAGAKTDDIVFNNAFNFQPHNLMVDPPVQKTVSGNPGTNGLFTFSLTAQNPANPMPSGSSNGVKTLTISGSGAGEFGTWVYDQPGVYIYTIAEVNSGLAGYTYDTTVYTITDTVTSSGGVLQLNRVVTNNLNNQVTACAFLNTYVTPTTGGGGGGGGGSYFAAYFTPRTGDHMNTGLYTALLITSVLTAAVAAVYMAFRAKRRKKGGSPA